MKKRRRYFPMLIGAFICIILLVLLIVFYSPQSHLNLFFFQFPTTSIFFVLVGLASSLLSTFLFTDYKQGVLFGVYIVVVLFLRYLGFTNLIYPVLGLLLVILIVKAIKQ